MAKKRETERVVTALVPVSANKKGKKTVLKKTAFVRPNPRSGKDERIGTFVDFTDGTNITLLTPNGKGAKYAKELEHNVGITNDGFVKKDKKGRVIKLTDKQRSYRSGYLDARKDAAKAYKAKLSK